MSYFFKLGLSLLTQRRRQDLPVRWRRPLDRMELQSLGPKRLTWFKSTSSSSSFHGPFLKTSCDCDLLSSIIVGFPSQNTEFLEIHIQIFCSCGFMLQEDDFGFIFLFKILFCLKRCGGWDGYSPLPSSKHFPPHVLFIFPFLPFFLFVNFFYLILIFNLNF